MNGQQWFRFSCIAILWVVLCYIVLTSQPVTPRVIFIIVASAIVVFVPLYKKYVKRSKSDTRRNGK